MYVCMYVRNTVTVCMYVCMYTLSKVGPYLCMYIMYVCMNIKWNFWMRMKCMYVQYLVLAHLAYGGGACECVSEEVPLLRGAVIQSRRHVREDGADPLVNHGHLDVPYIHTYIHYNIDHSLQTWWSIYTSLLHVCITAMYKSIYLSTCMYVCMYVCMVK